MLFTRITCIFFILVLPCSVYGRTNSLTTGVSISFDYNDRAYDPQDSVSDDTGDNQAESDDDDDYTTIAISPLIHFVSKGSKDNFELRTAPKIKYDLVDSDTDWDNDLKIAASRYITRRWQVDGSDHFIRSDYREDATDDMDVSSSELSSDPGRQRYWRNELNLGSTWWYGSESLVKITGGYTALRNDDDSATDTSYEDYDRYQTGINGEHRFSRIWQSTGQFYYVRGDYHPQDTDETDDESEEESGDIREYHLLASLVNSRFYHNDISLSYSYIGSRYDDALQEDGDIHQGRITWSREFSPYLSTKLGIGPSYEKTEDQGGTWGGNGIAEISFSTQYSSWGFSLEKNYDVDNFSGTDERGTVDYWNLGLSYRYLVFRDLTFSADFNYLYEDQDELVLDEDEYIASYEADQNTNAEDYYTLQQYNKQGVTVKLGLTYNLLKSYAAAVDYTFYRQDSEQEDEDYTDQRILFTLSWKQKTLQW